MLQINDLHVEYTKHNQRIPAVRGVSFELREGDSLGIVGESGCGKSTVARAIMGLISPHEGKISQGNILLNDDNIRLFNKKRLQNLRGSVIGMIFQDPFNSLNPLLTAGEQISECLVSKKYNNNSNKKEVYNKMLELLKNVQIPNPERTSTSYPHQLSGGMRQRVMIAIAISKEPKILIADEPTTALDVTIQKDILQLLADLRRKLHMAFILITHNLGIVANNTMKIIVIYAGKVMEESSTKQLFKNPLHPYTTALLASVPSLHTNKELRTIPGKPPDPLDMPRGCAFSPRCPQAHAKCFIEEPPLLTHEGRKVRCNLYE